MMSTQQGELRMREDTILQIVWYRLMGARGSRHRCMAEQSAARLEIRQKFFSG
jgi:hypothetical protein